MNPLHLENHTMWAAYCKNERHQAIFDLETLIDKYGFISDYKMYSDISLMMQIEIEVNKVPELFKALENYMTIEEETKAGLKENATEVTIYLNVTFIQGKGDLKMEIPAVPG